MIILQSVLYVNPYKWLDFCTEQCIMVLLEIGKDIMARNRDNQRSRVYAWERKATKWFADRPLMKSLEEVEEWMRPIWRAERGRVGLAKYRVPELSRNLWGQRSASAGHDHVLKLPKWARNPWVVLHEMAHRLTPNDEPHGPRFVGVLIGLVARHDGRDANWLMELADEMGVHYHVRSIGCVPIIKTADRILARKDLPIHEVELAIEEGLHWKQIRGAVLSSGGALRMRGRMVVRTAGAAT